MIGRSFALGLICSALACLSGVALAQSIDPPTGAPGLAAKASSRHPKLTEPPVPKAPSPLTQFNLETSDNGRSVQQRLELELPNSNNTFLFGKKTTSYPLERDPGQEYRPNVPLKSPEYFSFGIGKRF